MALLKSTDETVLRMKGNMGAIISCADPKGCEEKGYWSKNDPLKARPCAITRRVIVR